MAATAAASIATHVSGTGFRPDPVVLINEVHVLTELRTAATAGKNHLSLPRDLPEGALSWVDRGIDLDRKTRHGTVAGYDLATLSPSTTVAARDVASWPRCQREDGSEHLVSASEVELAPRTHGGPILAARAVRGGRTRQQPDAPAQPLG